MNKPKHPVRPKPKPEPDYEFDIPSRDAVLKYLNLQGRPASLHDIADALKVGEKEARKALRRRLRAMQRDGQIIRTRKQGYAPVDKIDLLSGRVIAHPDGFGFLSLDAGGDDLYLSPREMRSVLHGDRVLSRITGVDHRGRNEAAIVEILERKNSRVVGRYHRESGIGFVIPDDRRIHQDILISGAEKPAIKKGSIVVCEITRQPDRHTQPIGKIIEVLGDRMEGDMAVQVAMRKYELPYEWSAGVDAEAKKFTGKVKKTAKQNREDLRALPLVTIDGEDARDFDDAVYCERQGNGWRLLVAIADVSNYVKPGTALDEAALERGTSVYFPQSVLPMLPEILSNELCSLKPEVDRLCFACEMHLTAQGKVKRTRFFKAIMRSHARLTYTQVAGVLRDGKAGKTAKLKRLLPHLKNLHELYQCMHSLRARQGLLDFDNEEPVFQFNDAGEIASIHTFKRNDAHRLIEEFMLAANVAAAGFLLQHEIPALYRVHATPKPEKLTELRAFLSELGLDLGGGEEPEARDYASLMQGIGDRDDAHLIQTVLLRSLPLAVYAAENAGHFGLAFTSYTHFTSPIRRYPDLLVHRAIAHVLEHGTAEGFYIGSQRMAELGTHCSMTERRADDASRDVIQWYKCQFMESKVGEVFDGTISSVTSFGLFVELDDIFIEGLVHVTSLPGDYYHYESTGHRLRGERTHKVYQLAERIRVKVVRVDVDDRKIDFEPA
ncbi:MAG: ribonuclease R [Thiotrichales bacterium]|nr:ribonuclease R [Thiotrichales bacterium]